MCQIHIAAAYAITPNAGCPNGPAPSSIRWMRRVTGRRMCFVSATVRQIGTRSARIRCWTMWKVANCSPRRSTGEISATNSSAMPSSHSAEPPVARRPRPALPPRRAPASDIDPHVGGQRDQDDRREVPARVDRLQRPRTKSAQTPRGIVTKRDRHGTRRPARSSHEPKRPARGGAGPRRLAPRRPPARRRPRGPARGGWPARRPRPARGGSARGGPGAGARRLAAVAPARGGRSGCGGVIDGRVR